ncbi:MAG: homoserine dehydrogenase [Alphaproteobacteria bacterium CG_4_10_14_0_2_um_filter_63_37]|nr:MAG: homoserine dehydrogenase [Proteobacteria bacterium CG1_02_64_396]PJA25160.1 MAG: homoserine dehydrogenase [Alphaproteobacteria bacterium CG_4_10_14_0_2_um_filter_63_37]
MKRLNIGVLGFGTIGTGVVKILAEQRDLIAQRSGVELVVTAIGDLDLTRDRGVDTSDIRLTNDARSIINDPEIDVVVELIGGYEPARTFVLEALQAGKHVVTANKALIAKHGMELFPVADSHGVTLAFEASVAGTIPIVKVLREGLAANPIRALYGIINGTCNYILSRMRDEGLPFEEVLADAQKLGYAEADPAFDIEGIDAAHKLAILGAIAFGTPIHFDQVSVEGITKITGQDVAYAEELGYRVKLLGIAKQAGDAVELRVHPTLLPASNPLAQVEGVFNAVLVDAQYADRTMYYGRGAGELPTASAVVADLIDIACGRQVAPLGVQPGVLRERPIRSQGEIECGYYLRLSVADRPGVLATLTRLLADQGVSIEAVRQYGRAEACEAVPLILTVHRTREAAFIKALDEIRAQPFVGADLTWMRIEEN